MTVPLVILAALSAIAGYEFFAKSIFGADIFRKIHEAEHASIVPTLAISVFVIGTLGAWLVYKGTSVAKPAAKMTDLPKDPVVIPLFANKFYIDELYAALIAGTQDTLASLSGWIDRVILDGVIVRGIAGITWGAGYALRLLQFGNLQGYAFLFGTGVVVLLYLLTK